MLVRVHHLGVGTHENEPCENKPGNVEFATCNKGNGFERTRQGEALSSSRGQHAQQTAGSPSCLCRLRVERQFELGGLPADKVIE